MLWKSWIEMSLVAFFSHFCAGRHHGSHHYWPFSVWSMVSPYTKMAKNATNDISIQEFYNVTRHYVKDTGNFSSRFYLLLIKNFSMFLSKLWGGIQILGSFLRLCINFFSKAEFIFQHYIAYKRSGNQLFGSHLSSYGCQKFLRN